MVRKYVATGAVFGVAVGAMVGLLYPQFLWNILKSQAEPGVALNYWTAKSGSALDMLKYFMLFGGLVGAFLGFLFSRFKK